MDLILGSFADRRLAALSEDELTQFEDILGAVDGDLYSWITGKTPLPARYDTSIMTELRTFKPLADVLKNGKSG